MDAGDVIACIDNAIIVCASLRTDDDIDIYLVDCYNIDSILNKNNSVFNCLRYEKQ